MVYINDKAYDFIEGESLYDFLKRSSFDPDFLACEVDAKLVKRKDFKNFTLEDGARVEAFSIVGGG
ncbi:MAG: sulfur carrier protein ThiS [Anaerococcus sp.]|jgi:sulfur carrier protein|nr:sulfur carrier protein ThiS [Peptoniphilaceae bacterium]MDY3054571.1 sulfur carrier protein ThiS [Anaerococcus sp.]